MSQNARYRGWVRTLVSLSAVAVLSHVPKSHAQGPAPAAAPSKDAQGKVAQAPAGENPTATGPAAASDAEARKVALLVQSFYDQTKSVESEFHQTYFTRIYNKYDKSHGQVKFQKPGKMRWDYAAPNGKIIVSNGAHLLVYEPGENKDEPGQVFERSISESDLPQALSFLTGSGKLVDEFTFRLLDAKQQGFTGGYVLELLPKKKSPHFERILFYVDSDPKRAGLVHRVLIVDASGNRNRIDFKSPRFNRAIDAAHFNWQPPKGTRRITP